MLKAVAGFLFAAGSCLPALLPMLLAPAIASSSWLAVLRPLLLQTSMPAWPSLATTAGSAGAASLHGPTAGGGNSTAAEAAAGCRGRSPVQCHAGTGCTGASTDQPGC